MKTPRHPALRFWLLAAAAAAVLSSGSAMAQDAPEPAAVISPLKTDPDVNGVNLLDGQKIVDMPVVLSVPAAPHLVFDRVQNAAPYVLGIITHNPPDTPGSSSWSVHYGGNSSEAFKCVDDGVCTSVTATGSRWAFAGHQYQQAGSGVIYAFNLRASLSSGGTNTQELRYAVAANYPDGESISYTYQAGVTGGFLPSCVSAPPNADCQTSYRPTRIDSDTGYYITISYQYTGTDAGNLLWGTPAQAALYSPSGTLIRRLVYSGTTITDYGNSPTNVGGRTFTSTAPNGLAGQLETTGASTTLPGEGSAQLVVAGSSSHGSWHNPLIDSVTRDGVGWTYTYANARGDQLTTAPATYALRYDSVSVAGPNGYHVTYTMYPNSAFSAANNHNLVQSRTDALGHTTSYLYDQDRPIRVTMPEGNWIGVSYDDCGNIFSRTSTPKAGSGLTAITETAVYPVSTGVTPCPSVLNYRPTSFTDARGHMFSYTYNGRGQLTQELAPADSNGVRRETDITYATNAGGISLKTLVRVCGQTTTCAGTAESRTEYTYVGNTALPATVTQKDETSGATRTTTYTYDAAGRPTVVDGPLTGTGDAKYFQYDTFGRKIWEVGELAPNNLRLAKKFTYRNSDDKVTNVQSGTVACTSGCDTAALTLTLLQQTDTTYDGRRYPIREKTYKGTTVLSVTDRSFLDRGLEDCTTVRMNFGALPTPTSTSACSLGTQRSQGPDRITKNSYDSAGQLIKVQKAYGTTDQTDYVTYTYTSNGKQLNVTDAKGNRAQFQYDGFDRLLRWIFPSKTTSGALNTIDYEQYGYDAAGNRTTLLKRDGSLLTFTYDALNRMTSKVATVGNGSNPPASDLGGGGGDDGGGGGDGGGNTAPVAVNDVGQVSICQTGIFDVVSNDTDADGDTLHLVSVSGTGFTIPSASKTEIRYVSTALRGAGNKVATYVVADPSGASDTGTLTVTVTDDGGCQ